MNDKLKKMVWDLYQTRKKNSSPDEDTRKLTEEIDEFMYAFWVEHDKAKSIVEASDILVSLFGSLMWICQPATSDDCGLYIDNVMESFEYKSERTDKRLKEGFYNDKMP